MTKAMPDLHSFQFLILCKDANLFWALKIHHQTEIALKNVYKKIRQRQLQAIIGNLFKWFPWKARQTVIVSKLKLNTKQ